MRVVDLTNQYVLEVSPGKKSGRSEGIGEILINTAVPL
jgi:hypothetical protein